MGLVTRCGSVSLFWRGTTLNFKTFPNFKYMIQPMQNFRGFNRTSYYRLSQLWDILLVVYLLYGFVELTIVFHFLSMPTAVTLQLNYEWTIQ